jgi:hypothetical protein
MFLIKKRWVDIWILLKKVRTKKHAKYNVKLIELEGDV